ncbi:AAA family ATPase [Pseudophaeobacter sp. A-200-2]|uniref:AAA family ATPase n=1 Tax=Pseudophaeobacter sp. A-200-2 TaxID=3098145 RepID=UPI0034D5182A
MKLCSIRLENLRRFTDPVEITGIGPGLNVLAAPNEQGKSTIFDALHALFFKDAKAWDKEIRGLVPHAGGDPRVEVEVDHEGARYRIAKQFFKTSGKGEVRIWREGTLLHQADAAEAWLKALIKPPKEDGPSGLLWVRQGLTSFEDAKETLSARRDLLSSVAGEVEMVTGGQRMDAIRRRVREALDQLVTTRGARKGGALDLAERAVADLVQRRDQLSAQVQELRQLLDQRRALQVEQAALNDPEERAELQARLEAAEAAMEAANRHQEHLAQASHAVQLAETVLENHQRKIAVLTARLEEATVARAALAETTETAERARASFEQQEEQQRKLTEAATQAREAARKARATLDAVLQAISVAQAEGLRRDLSDRLKQARVQAAQIDSLAKAAGRRPDEETLRRIEAASEAYNLARRAQEATATAVTVHYQAGHEGSIRLDGAGIPEGKRMPLPGGGRLVVPGVAEIDIHPGQAGGAEALEQAQAALTQLLEQAGCTSVEEARTRHKARQEAQQQRQEAQTLLKVLAPDGIKALIDQVEALPQAPEADTPEEGGVPLPDRAEAEATFRAAEQEAEAAENALEAIRSAAADSRLAMENASARADAAVQRLDRALAVIEGQEQAAEALQRLSEDLPALQQNLSQAKATETALRQAAPDPAQTRAILQRAQSAQDAARQRAQEVARDLAVLETRIATHASAAVEEELADTEGQLDRAQKRLAAVEFEVAVLRRLDAALERARSEAQEHYVGPVMAELRPLLRMLWPEAELSVDAGKVLPEELQRGGETAAFDSLSGGTQEQIALLVRLAFARLLARSGHPAPVILDDAIVYTDDARIEKIFDALTMQADELQILVFSCRQKAFRGLGGTQLTIRPVEAGSQ